MGSGGPCAEPQAGPLVAVVSSNQVGRIDLTPIALLESVFLTLSRQEAMVHRRDHPCGDEYGDVLDILCYVEVLGLEVRCNASDLPIDYSYVRFRAVKGCRDFKTQVQFPKPVFLWQHKR